MIEIKPSTDISFYEAIGWFGSTGDLHLTSRMSQYRVACFQNLLWLAGLDHALEFQLQITIILNMPPGSDSNTATLKYLLL